MKKITYFVLFAILFAVCYYFASSRNVLRVMRTKGTVDIKLASSPSFEEAKPDMILKAGDVIRTGDDSYVQVQLVKDNSQVKLLERTFLEVAAIDTGSSLTQQNGIAIYRINKQKKNLKIMTPQGMATVLGTVLRIDATASETAVTVKEGRVAFQKNGSSEPVFINSLETYKTDFALAAAQKLSESDIDALFTDSAPYSVIKTSQKEPVKQPVKQPEAAPAKSEPAPADEKETVSVQSPEATEAAEPAVTGGMATSAQEAVITEEAPAVENTEVIDKTAAPAAAETGNADFQAPRENNPSGGNVGSHGTSPSNSLSSFEIEGRANMMQSAQRALFQ